MLIGTENAVWFITEVDGNKPGMSIQTHYFVVGGVSIARLEMACLLCSLNSQEWGLVL